MGERERGRDESAFGYALNTKTPPPSKKASVLGRGEMLHRDRPTAIHMAERKIATASLLAF